MRKIQKVSLARTSSRATASRSSWSRNAHRSRQTNTAVSAIQNYLDLYRCEISATRHFLPCSRILAKSRKSYQRLRAELTVKLLRLATHTRLHLGPSSTKIKTNFFANKSIWCPSLISWLQKREVVAQEEEGRGEGKGVHPV